MKAIRLSFILGLAVLFLLAAGGTLAQQQEPGTYAVMKTNVGTMTFKLYTKEAPETTANFIGLAKGTKQWKDPFTGDMVKKPLYNGIIFHRIIKGFMIQAGCPLGVGIGGPGYKFKDEFDPSLQFDAPGILAMANSGPATNGSQFFITERPTPHLNNRHTIFGKIVSGSDVLKKIASTPTKMGKLSEDHPETLERVRSVEPGYPDRYRDRPMQDVVIETITIKVVK